MNVTVIYGNSDKSITYKYAHFLLNNLESHVQIKLTEHFLPKDFSLSPDNYSQYSTTQYNNDDFSYIIKIAKSINDADLIIWACSSVQKHTLPPSLKLLLNYLSYIQVAYLNNMPMSNKIGLVISNDYIPILPSISKALKKHFKLWGIKNILSFNFHNTSEAIHNENFISKDYLKLIFLSMQIVNLITSNPLFSYLKSKKVIKFPCTQIMTNKKIYNKNSISKVIPLRNIQNNL